MIARSGDHQIVAAIEIAPCQIDSCTALRCELLAQWMLVEVIHAGRAGGLRHLYGKHAQALRTTDHQYTGILPCGQRSAGGHPGIGQVIAGTGDRHGVEPFRQGHQHGVGEWHQHLLGEQPTPVTACRHAIGSHSWHRRAGAGASGQTLRTGAAGDLPWHRNQVATAKVTHRRAHVQHLGHAFMAQRERWFEGRGTSDQTPIQITESRGDGPDQRTGRRSELQLGALDPGQLAGPLNDEFLHALGTPMTKVVVALAHNLPCPSRICASQIARLRVRSTTQPRTR